MADLTKQDQVLLSRLIERLPLGDIPKAVKQLFIEDPKAVVWLADQMALYTKASADVKKLIIDCDTSPFIPDGWKVVEHKQGGQLEWDKEKFSNPDLLHLAEGKKNGKWIAGHDLRKKLADKPTLNANVLDFLLAHPELIPDSWKGKVIFFWGTIYSASCGGLYVRYLCWRGDEWGWDCDWLRNVWSGDYSALLASA